MGTVKLVKNLQCPCGSGLKYKHCCWEDDRRRGLKTQKHGWPEEDNDNFKGKRSDRKGFSDGIVAYAWPFLEKAGDNPEGIQKALTLAGMFWNIAQLKEAQRKKEIEDIARKLSTDKEDHAAFYEMADFMLDRYERMFGKKRSPVCPDCGGPLEEHRPAAKTRLPPRWIRILLLPAVMIWVILSSFRRRLKQAWRHRTMQRSSP